MTTLRRLSIASSFAPLLLAGACSSSTPAPSPADASAPVLPFDVPAAWDGVRDDTSVPLDTVTPVDTQTTPVDVQTAPDVPTVTSGCTPATGTPVTMFQFDAQRDGANRCETSLTPAALMAGRFGMDTAFSTSLDGQVYAQPLYLPQITVAGAMHNVLYVATQANTIFGLDASTGATLWHTGLGTPVQRSSQPCGNISPTTGVLGTPVIDIATGTLYAVAYTQSGGANVFTLNALDVASGMQHTGYPVPMAPPSFNGQDFETAPQGERSALAFVDGRIYVTFGGLYGDCGNYHGWVVGVDPAHPGAQISFATTGAGSGIWAPAGASADGMGHIFVATGNSLSVPTGTQPLGEHVLRLATGATGPTWSGLTTDFFAPSNMTQLDAADQDVGSNSPVVLPTVDGMGLVAQGNKAGVEYLVNANNLGGFGTGDGNTGEAAYSARIFAGGIYGAAAAYTDGTDTYLFVPGRGARAMACSTTGTGGVMALRVTVTGAAPSYTMAWCTGSAPNPNPPAISANGNTDGILWTLGTPAGGMTIGTFAAYQISTGMQVWNATGSDLPAVRQWVPPVVADGRVYVTGPTGVQMFRLLR